MKTKTIKIIDLLNKIAKGEEVPVKVKYNLLEDTKDYVYTYSQKDNDYTCFDEFDEKQYLFTQIFMSTIPNLNDEVEIIEEYKIKRIEERESGWWGNSADGNVLTLKQAVNELIDAVNEMRKKD